MFSAVTRGLDQPAERWALGGCIALLVLYVATLAGLQRASVRIDDVFFTRREAVRLQRLLTHRMTLDQPMPVSSAGAVADSLALVSGWSAPEAWGVWTLAGRAELAIALPEGDASHPALALWATIATPPGGLQRIKLQAGNTLFGSWQIADHHAMLCAALPPVAGNEPIRIVIEVGSPQRPPGGQDARELGVGLERIAILHDVSSCPADALHPGE